MTDYLMIADGREASAPYRKIRVAKPVDESIIEAGMKT
jgi:hypothetical protein